jgi:hypothetical protein
MVSAETCLKHLMATHGLVIHRLTVFWLSRFGAALGTASAR